jgi:hypothetical protein
LVDARLLLGFPPAARLPCAFGSKIGYFICVDIKDDLSSASI